MAKEDTKIKPEITASPRLTAEHVPEGHHPGNYLIEQPDKELISVTPRMYERVYKKLSDHQVKKSPNE